MGEFLQESTRTLHVLYLMSLLTEHNYHRYIIIIRLGMKGRP